MAVPHPPALRDWVRDPPRADVERGHAPLRIVSTAPSTTEICCALGLRDQLVGRTRFCDYPPEIEHLPAVGDLDETNVETLVALRPDLVLVSGASRAITDRLAGLNLHVAALPDRSLADILAAIAQAGELTGRPQTARLVVDGLHAELAQTARAYSDTPPARVLILLGTLSDPPAPPFVAGPGSYFDDLLRLAGHHNAADADVPAYGPWSLETIVRSDPDVIIEIDTSGRARPGGDADARRLWQKLGPLRAVADGRVHVLTGKAHLIPGPRIALSFAALCRAIAGVRP
jgi:iron complex transport system substrate-binding protein